MTDNTHAYCVVGFVSVTGRPQFDLMDEYLDWLGYGWHPAEMRHDLYMGRIPEGAILQTPKGLRMVVGQRGRRYQRLAPVCESSRPGPGKDTDFDPKRTASRLREVRLRLRYTQGEMAECIGMQRATLSRLERGVEVHHFHGKTVAALRRFYRSYLEGRDGG